MIRSDHCIMRWSVRSTLKWSPWLSSCHSTTAVVTILHSTTLVIIIIGPLEDQTASIAWWTSWDICYPFTSPHSQPLPAYYIYRCRQVSSFVKVWISSSSMVSTSDSHMTRIFLCACGLKSIHYSINHFLHRLSSFNQHINYCKKPISSIEHHNRRRICACMSKRLQ